MYKLKQWAVKEAFGHMKKNCPMHNEVIFINSFLLLMEFCKSS